MIEKLGLPVASADLMLAILVAVLGAAGIYQMLPHRHGWAKPWRAHAVGGGLVALAIVLLASFWSPSGPFLAAPFFYAFSLLAIGAGVMMVTGRNPIYSALWFAAVVLSTSGLFMLAGAQFLAAGTVIIYAGAIIVTFLFVIMLAQMEGRALYDRMARTPARVTLTSFLFLFGMIYALLAAETTPVVGPRDGGERRLERTAGLPLSAEGRAAVEHAITPTLAWPEGRTKATREKAEGDLPEIAYPHVAGLGGTLYTDHLIAVELAGALLFVALIGAIAIATPRRPIRPGDSQANRIA